MSRDPIRRKNLFAFCLNNSIGLIDSLGLAEEAAIKQAHKDNASCAVGGVKTCHCCCVDDLKITDIESFVRLEGGALIDKLKGLSGTFAASEKKSASGKRWSGHFYNIEATLRYPDWEKAYFEDCKFTVREWATYSAIDANNADVANQPWLKELKEGEWKEEGLGGHLLSIWQDIRCRPAGQSETVKIPDEPCVEVSHQVPGILGGNPIEMPTRLGFGMRKLAGKIEITSSCPEGATGKSKCAHHSMTVAFLQVLEINAGGVGVNFDKGSHTQFSWRDNSGKWSTETAPSEKWPEKW